MTIDHRGRCAYPDCGGECLECQPEKPEAHMTAITEAAVDRYRLYLDLARQCTAETGNARPMSGDIIRWQHAKITALETAAPHAPAPDAVQAAVAERWQPFASAPKDGTYFLACQLPHDTVLMMSFTGGFLCWEPGRWKTAIEPTHWYPIPALPIARSAAPQPTGSGT